jgi:hypothetical protein
MVEGVDNAMVDAMVDALPPNYEGPAAMLYDNAVGRNPTVNVSDNDHRRGVFGN